MLVMIYLILLIAWRALLVLAAGALMIGVLYAALPDRSIAPVANEARRIRHRPEVLDDPSCKGPAVGENEKQFLDRCLPDVWEEDPTAANKEWHLEIPISYMGGEFSRYRDQGPNGTLPSFEACQRERMRVDDEDAREWRKQGFAVKLGHCVRIK
jgi:hypothetical protein